MGKSPHQLTDNIRNNQSLLETLQQSDWKVLPAWGVPDVPVWPPEASYLILGISTKDARLIAQQFNQHAFVFGHYQKTAKLCQLSAEPNDNFHATMLHAVLSISKLYRYHFKSTEELLLLQPNGWDTRPVSNDCAIELL